MNLHAVVSGAIGAVNPHVSVQVQFSTGATTAPSGKRVASYSAPVTMLAQVQPLTSGDIRHLDGQNVQGIMRAMYLSGSLEGIVRVAQKGGDLVTMPNGSVYLVTTVLERWDGVGWCKVAVTLQDGS